jgi:uncharacterized protein
MRHLLAGIWAARMRTASILTTSAVTAVAWTLTVSWSAPALAEAADPTVHQVYEAAESGHLDQAQQMMDQVLRDHPNSGKAHYVQAELYAKEGQLALARTELSKAESFDTGLSHESSGSVQALKAQLALTRAADTHVIGTAAAATPVPGHFPWGTILVAALAIGGLWMLLRPHTPYSSGYAAAGSMPSGPAGPGYGGGGIGSGLAGGLASGLAVGAGVVAGEELARHFLDGGHPGGGIIPSASAGESDSQAPNNDIGGTDFGVNEGGWDDSVGGGGGDDWT